jgi:hypothetical protein
MAEEEEAERSFTKNRPPPRATFTAPTSALAETEKEGEV